MLLYYYVGTQNAPSTQHYRTKEITFHIFKDQIWSRGRYEVTTIIHRSVATYGVYDRNSSITEYQFGGLTERYIRWSDSLRYFGQSNGLEIDIDDQLSVTNRRRVARYFEFYRPIWSMVTWRVTAIINSPIVTILPFKDSVQKKLKRFAV